jgi:hypothetical protein
MLPTHPYSITYNSDRAREPRAGKSGSDGGSSSRGRVRGHSSTVRGGGYCRGGGGGGGSSSSSSSSNSSSGSSVAASTIERKLLNYLRLIC